MHWFRSLKTSRKLALAFGFLEILMISLGALSLVQLSKVNTVADHIVNNSLPKVRALGALRHAASNMRRDELSFLATVEDKSKWAAAMKISLANVEQAQQDYERLINSQEERQIYNGFSDGWRKYVEIHNKAMAMVATNEYEAGILARGAGNEAFDNASHFLEQDMDLQQKAALEAASRAASAYTESRYWVLGLLSVAALAAFVLATVLGRSMSQAISAMLERIQQIADNNLAGDDIDADSGDEFGQAGAALNRMKNNLAEVIRVIAETSQRVATATEEISSASRETAQGALSQAEQTNQVATAMQEMAATVQQVSENAQKASESSQQSAVAARQAGEIADENLATMRSISQTTSKVALSISELGQQSEQIGRIAAVIDEIADQTNLLALNAAIEAARAGDQGRGFAVVADEVRKLAERTTAATKEIASMITTIQSGTRSAVETTDLNHQQVEAGVTRTQASGDALRGIIQMSEDVGSMVTGIATAASEQARATEDINHSITQISTLSNNSSSSAEQTARACSNLSSLAVDLQELVSRFRLKTSAISSTSTGKPKLKAMAASAR